MIMFSIKSSALDAVTSLRLFYCSNIIYAREKKPIIKKKSRIQIVIYSSIHSFSYCLSIYLIRGQEYHFLLFTLKL
jgi:hypothetical protein